MKILSFLLCLLVILSGCKKDKKEPSPVAAAVIKTNILNQNAHIVDTSLISNVTATSVTIAKGNSVYIPSVGDIIIASPSVKNPMGLLVKVTGINTIGSTITCGTQMSNLNDAFKELYINYTYNNQYSTQVNAGSSANQPVILTSPPNMFLNFPSTPNGGSSTGGSNLTIPFNKVSLGSGLVFDGGLQINVPKTIIKYVKLPGSSLPDTIIISASLNTISSYLNITSSTVTLTEKTLSTINLPTIYVPVPIGAVVIPIPFTQKIKLNVLPASISGKMTLEVYPQLSASLGMSYINGTLTNLSKFSIGASADSLQRYNFDASVTATATIFNPTYEIAPFGSDAANLFFSIPNDLTLTIQPASPNYLLKYNLGVALGFNLNFWTGASINKSLDASLIDTTLLRGDFKKTTWNLFWYNANGLDFYQNGIFDHMEFDTFAYIESNDGQDAKGIPIHFTATGGTYKFPVIVSGSDYPADLNHFISTPGATVISSTISATLPDGTFVSHTN